MGKIKNYVLVGLCMILQSCILVKTQTPTTTWKEALMYHLQGEYTIFSIYHKKNCGEPSWDYLYDYQRKIQAIREYPYNVMLSKLKKYVVKNNIQFDSLLMENCSVPELEQIEYTCPIPTFVTIFNGNNVKSIFVGIKNCEEVYGIEDAGKDYHYDRQIQNGCGLGFNSFTMYDKNWNFKIKRIVINPRSD